MGKLSVLIPSRSEQFLIPTLEGCFSKAEGEVEVVVVLEGYVPDGWPEVIAKYPNLHTIYHNEPKGLRPSINAAAASAMSRGAKCLFKLDAHCLLDESYDVKIQADMEPNWVVVPRRHRLDAENWCVDDGSKPPIDYHYLSFPDDSQDFGGAGLNGKVWEQRARDRKGKPEYDVDWEMSSQGSAWATRPAYFTQLELMDDASYGTFWNEMQEIGLKAWLSGGQLMVNKRTWYAHLHKGRKYGRGYHLQESLLKQGRNHTMKWLYNEAWAKQTLPFKSLIERFWPVPTWPEDWEGRVYAQRKPRAIASIMSKAVDGSLAVVTTDSVRSLPTGLVIHAATYGIGAGLGPNADLDVTDHLQSLVKDNALDIVVSNSTICPGQNPHRGKRKKLLLTYAYDGGEPVTVERVEKDWLIIGQAQARTDIIQDRMSEVMPQSPQLMVFTEKDMPPNPKSQSVAVTSHPLSATALNDYLIRKFQIPAQRLRGPMPIEVPTFHRNDLAQLFAELGFSKGAEVGVAEADYSEVLLKANPSLELHMVDPWHAYSGNPQNKSKEKNEYAYQETLRKTKGYKMAIPVMDTSMEYVRGVVDGLLDFVYIDGHHGFDYVMQDLIEWSKKVRSGGLVTGDDLLYLDEKRWGAGPIEAVQAYVKAHRIATWFIFQGHKSVDFMWVKP